VPGAPIWTGLLVLVACQHDPSGGTPAPTGKPAPGDDPRGAPMTSGGLTRSAHVDHPASRVAFAPDGELVTAGDGWVARWRGRTPGSPIDVRAWGPVRNLAVAADGTVLAGAARVAADGSIQGTPRDLERAWGAPRTYSPSAAVWTRDGAQLWISVRKQLPRGRQKPGQQPPTGPSRRFLVLDAGLALVRELAADASPAWWSDGCAGDGWVATVGGDLTVWPVAGGGGRQLAKGPPVAVAASPDGALLVAADLGQVTVWDAASGTSRARFAVGGGAALTAAAVAAGGALVATAYADGKVTLWRVSGEQASAAADVSADPLPAAMAFSADGKSLALVSASPPGGTTLFAVK
jgi:WD40 repeat protein